MSDKISKLIETESRSQSENQKTFQAQKPAFRVWRMLNTAILLFGFFSPWFKSCSTELSGLDLAKITAGSFLDLVQKPPVFLIRILYSCRGLSLLMQY